MSENRVVSCSFWAPALDKMTIRRWRRKIIRALGGSGASSLGGVVDVDEKFFRESRKGWREWVRHERDPVSHPKAGPDALDRLHAHGNETAGRHLAVSASGSHDGGSRWRQARGRSARTTARRR